MKYYDCFMYFDEDMVLDLRLNILDRYVSKFIICEATYNHKGLKKKLNFNIQNFQKFKDKIIFGFVVPGLDMDFMKMEFFLPLI